MSNLRNPLFRMFADPRFANCFQSIACKSTNFIHINSFVYMKAVAFVLCVAFIHGSTACQQSARIKIVRITTNPVVKQDFSAWLADDLETMVPNLWSKEQFRYIDVRLDFESPAAVSKIALYDFEGSFPENPASIYAVNGQSRTLLGVFTGERYKEFVEFSQDTPVIAEGIIIHKYANNIPQKVQVYGELPGEGGTGLPSAIIGFNDIPEKLTGNLPFYLHAVSDNKSSPVVFTSSDSTVVTISSLGDSVFAKPVGPGTAIITASQAAGGGFRAALPVEQIVRVVSAGTSLITNAKIPLDAKRWFQLTNASNSAAGLFDGDTLRKVETGWGKILNNYDHYYPVLKGERIDLLAIRMYDGEGENNKEPMIISVINDLGQKIVIGRFQGSDYKKWVGPDPVHPENFQLPVAFENIQYLVLNSYNFFPTEIEFIGNYTPSPGISAARKEAVPLRQMFGVNGFEWNFELPAAPGEIDAASYTAAKTFTGFRHYMDWEKLERTQGSYSYNPTLSGGWNYDALYDSCLSAGIEVVACLKTIPPWMMNSYPPAERDNENIPMMSGRDPALPASYIEQARMGFQFAARYGKNTGVNPALINVNTQPRWIGDKVNEKKTGLGTVKYIECENERDKWWKGRKAYQTAYEYAANLSAFYDGNKNSMGPGVGVKNADPDMLVVMAGTALASTDYLKGMIDWCRRNRGYREDGSVNLCWDVINYHYYSNDSRSSQNGQATRGAAPENSGAAGLAAEFMEIASTIGNNLPVWVTELGYDANQGSAFKAIPVAGKTALQTQADWILRSSLMYAKTGVERIFFYGMYDDNLNSALQFSSSGLLNENKTRKPAADFITQVNHRFGNYKFITTKNSNPVVDEYHNGTDAMFMLVLPSEQGRTAGYELDLPGFSYATLYTPLVGSEQMQMVTKEFNDGKLQLTVTETPLFVVPGEKPSNKLNTNVARSKTVELIKQQQLMLDKSVQVFPNPALNELKVLVNNSTYGPVSVKIYEGATGKLISSISLPKQGRTLNKTVDISKVPAGYFIVEISQGQAQVTRKILKQSR